VVAGIILKHKDVVDLVLVPDAAIEAKQHEQQINKKVSSIDLDKLAASLGATIVTHLEEIASVCREPKIIGRQ
jgi:hypothetical protein